ncbi:secretory component protein-like protein [Xylariomycetidae sp. FL2044]|nr:secretory component protein-like protein [Xylariomycetidae sp. FL2044]
MPEKWVDWNKTTRSKDYRGSASFATFMIIGPTCFFLGILFAQFPYDFPLLWTKDATQPAYLDQLETHLKFMHGAPPLIARVLNITTGVGFLGFFIKLFRASESNMLFDGASLVLYLVGVGVYITNIVKGLRFVTAEIWHQPGFAANTNHAEGGGGEVVLGREDSLKVMAASNTILALVLVGVLVLQAGQWYAERKDSEEFDKIEADEMEKKKTAAAESPTSSTKSSSKKKQ